MKEDGVQQMMLGNAAIARGAYEAGVKVSAAYPGTQVQKSVKILQLIKM